MTDMNTHRHIQSLAAFKTFYKSTKASKNRKDSGKHEEHVRSCRRQNRKREVENQINMHNRMC